MNSRNLKIILIVLIAFLLLVLFEAVKYKSDNDAKRFYKQGMEFYQKENYSDAYYNFKQINRYSNLYFLSLLKQFQCANYLSDKKTAHTKIKELAKLTRDDVFRPYVLYNEANLAQESGYNTKNRSEKKFKYILKNYPESDFGIASAYKLAKLQSSNIAKDNYILYLTHAPNGKYAISALEDLKENSAIINQKDKEIMANAYLANEKYIEALNLYKQVSFSNNWVKIAACYRGQGQLEQEKQTLLKGLELNKSEVEEKEISSSIDRLIAISGANKIQYLQTLYSKHPDSYIFPTVAYKLAQSSASIRSIKLYEYISKNYPDSYWASNSLWEVLWHNYKLSRFRVCAQIAKDHSKNYPDAQDAPRIMYWGAKALLKEKKNQEARESFYKIIKNYPFSYYAFLSTRQLKSSKANKLFFKKPVEKYSIDSINKALFKDKNLLLLSSFNDYPTIDELKINNEYIKSWVLNKKENYPMSIKIASDKFSDELTAVENKEYEAYKLKLIYPIFYEEEINTYSKQFKINPYLFLSLIREESHFDYKAKSAAGAIGLAQIMPDTANFIEKTPVLKETLLDKEENIRIGAKYFSYLINYFNQNEYLAILAYNAGPGNINKWINDPFIKNEEIDEFVEDVPFLETKNYIKKILSSYWAYITIYAPRNKI